MKRTRNHWEARVVSRRIHIGAGLAIVALICLSAAAAAVARYGNVTPALVRLTNSRYNHNCFWGGPRGRSYGSLADAQPIQKTNLYPDIGATYFAGQFKMPSGAYLSFTGRFPYARYMSYAIESNLGDGQTGGTDQLRDDQILPDLGSANPFVPNDFRNAPRRSYSIRVMSGISPHPRALNTVYTGTSDPTTAVTLVLRFYIPNQGRDGTGDAGLPRLELHLAGGQTLRGQAACQALNASKGQATGDLPVSLWKSLIASSSDPINAPVPYPAAWERFFNVSYSVLGTFITNHTQRATRYAPTDEGGFGSNPDTRYLTTGVSLKYGPIYTVTARMPTFPSTFAGTETHEPTDDVRYWSVCTGSAPTSGLGYDCVFDQQVALRDQQYTLVVSRPGDRPRNATTACGYTWLNVGKGEDDPGGGGRKYIDFMYMRFMDANPRWHHAPQDIHTPFTEPAVMGAYYPRGGYSTVRAFERRGCDREAR